jgi:hypothetical protein
MAEKMVFFEKREKICGNKKAFLLVTSFFGDKTSVFSYFIGSSSKKGKTKKYSLL